LIKISFLSEGIVNNLLIIGAVLFGYVILIIHNLYEKEDVDTKIQNDGVSYYIMRWYLETKTSLLTFF
jgi:hypothetical protein